ncbi:Hypothetical predicted protein [Paramuricea clavata]|uniref:Uncharacterized protein n=1 Tax=Paramuricea clavata TaxID=317549 RepID=A0A7D9F1B7_PARCT|nr:Hypothetical predicted protein [Paramuricea clavata]
MGESQEWELYLKNIFVSITKNATALEGDENVRELLKRCNEFYVSLFAKDDGVFKTSLCDKKLKTVPQVQPEATAKSTSNTPAKGTHKRGLGKGSPGCSRKENVTKRQQKNRAKNKDFETRRKRKSDETTTAETDPSTVQTAERPEPRQTLLTQHQNNKDIKTVSMIQDLCKTRKDNAPKSTEIDLFWVMMNSWKILDKRLVVALSQMKNDWTETLSDWRDEKFIKQMLAYHSTCDGITNCLHHMIGCMVKHAVEKNEKANGDDSAQSTYEDLEDLIIIYQYGEYEDVLAKCGCDLCKRVLAFDDRYER